MTPLTRYRGFTPRRPTDQELREAFMWHETRLVTKTATVSLLGNRYEVDQALCGRRVELRFDPYDLERIEVCYAGRPFGEALAHQVARHVHPHAREPADRPRPQSGISGTGLIGLLAATIQHATDAAHIRLDPGARELWHHAYTTQLATTPPGITGSLLARAEAHVIRLALLYALADGERQINTEHLKAALALWGYAARSASWALQGATGDPLAEQIHTALQHHPGGLTRSQISDVLQHNRPAEHIQNALNTLALTGRATRTQIPTAGRPAELWTAAPASAA